MRSYQLLTLYCLAVSVDIVYCFYGNAGNSCFQGFFNFPEMQVIAKHFCIYHLNALGQHERAQTLPNG